MRIMLSRPDSSNLRSELRHNALLSRLQVILAIATALAALATVPETIAQQHGDGDTGFRIAEWCIWSVFALEFGLSAYMERNLGRYLKRNWLSALVVFATFPWITGLFSLFGLVRLSRLFLLIRVYLVVGWGVRAFGQSAPRRGIIYLAMLTVLIVFVGGGLITIVEPQVVGDSFGSGIWWAIVTTTTVGYGDIAPHTAGGRAIAVVLMFAGMGLVSTFAGTVAAQFMEFTQANAEKEKRESEEAKAAEAAPQAVAQQPTIDTQLLLERLDRLERRLDQLLERKDAEAGS
ncbi:MAG TPA: potassium channel family protein [Limnochordia bacterium]|nr:potassium channel family protein [Limnochordia bacterium]